MRNPDPGPKRYTSLAWAVVEGNEDMFEFLLNAGHDDEELSRVQSTISLFRVALTSAFPQDSENSTILILLADIKPPLTTLYASSDPDLMGAALRMARVYYDRYPFILDWSDSSGKTALHVAALKGNEELSRVCLAFISTLFASRSIFRCSAIWVPTLTCPTTKGTHHCTSMFVAHLYAELS